MTVDMVVDVAGYLNSLALITSSVGEDAYPDNLDEYISVHQYAGLAPVYTHSHGNLPAQERPGLQIRVGALTPARAKELAYEAYFAVQDIVNEALGGTQYMGIMALGSPFPLERDAQERFVWVANFNVIREAPHG